MAKILYLAKRTKPECLTAISFLTTRVTKCTQDDEEKLERHVKYIRHSRHNTEIPSLPWQVIVAVITKQVTPISVFFLFMEIFPFMKNFLYTEFSLTQK